MRFIQLLGFALSGFVIFAGCTVAGGPAASTPIASTQPQQHGVGGSTLSTVARSAAFVGPDSAWTGQVIVSDLGTHSVNVYTSIGKFVAKLTGFGSQAGVTIDASGKVYVIVGDDIEVYANDYKTLVAVLSDTGQAPLDVAVAENSLIAVTNQITKNVPGSVSFFVPGLTTPCATVSDPAWNSYFEYGAFDKAGDFFLDGVGNSRTLVGVIKGGCSATSITTLSTTNQIRFPGALRVTPTGKIAILDDDAESIYTYNKPQNNALGAPIATTPLTDTGDTDTFAFAPGGAYVYGIDIERGGAFKYPYPAGGNALKSIKPLSFPISIVLTPSVAGGCATVALGAPGPRC